MTEQEMCAIFGKNLTNIMNEKGIKQADIVRGLGVAKATVSGWCSGLNIPRTDALSRLIQMLDVNPSDLLEEKKPTPVSESGPISPERQLLLDAVKEMDDETARAVLEVVKSVKKLRGE